MSQTRDGIGDLPSGERPSRAPALSRLERTCIAGELLLAVGALGGGALLFLAPDGSGLRMPLSMLCHSPFTTFRVPGAILFLVNGVLPLVSAAGVLRRSPWVGRSTVAVGALLAGWIVVQVALLRGFYAPLHGTYFLLGVTLAVLGRKLQRGPNVVSQTGRNTMSR